MTPQIEQAKKILEETYLKERCTTNTSHWWALQLALRVLGRCNEEFISQLSAKIISEKYNGQINIGSDMKELSQAIIEGMMKE